MLYHTIISTRSVPNRSSNRRHMLTSWFVSESIPTPTYVGNIRPKTGVNCVVLFLCILNGVDTPQRSKRLGRIPPRRFEMDERVYVVVANQRVWSAMWQRR